MLKHKASKRYAQALFNLARQEEHLEAVYKNLTALQGAIGESAAFAAFLQNAGVAAAVHENIFKTFHDKLHPLTFRFLNFLIKKRRLPLLPQVLDVFTELYQTHSNIVNLNIVSARPLSKEQVENLTKRMQNRLKKEILATQTVSPELIAGFRLQVDGTIYDYSVKALLEKFKNNVVLSD